MVSEIRIVTAASFFLAALLLTVQVSAKAEPSGHDWYGSAPEHKQYVKHLKHHLSHSGDAIAEKLDRIYNDPDLLPEEKKKRALRVLDNYLMKMRAGVGD